MNEVEYILRIVLKARDELAASLRKARNEIKGLVGDLEGHNSKLNAFNQSLKNMEQNVQNVTDKFQEWRAILEGSRGETDKTRKSFGDLGKEVDVTTKRVVTATKTQKAYYEQASRLNAEVKRLTQAEKEGNVTRDYAISQYQSLARSLENVSRRMTAGTQASQRAYEWSQRSAQAAKTLTEAKKKEADEFVAAEERKVKAVQRSNDLISKEIEDQITREEQAAKMRTNIVKRHNEEQSRLILQQIAVEEKASKDRIRLLEEERREQEKINNRQIEMVRAQQRATAARERMGAGRLGTIDASEARDTVQHLQAVSRQFSRTSTEARHLRGEAALLNDELRRNQQETVRSRGVLGALAQGFTNNRESVSALDNQLRGIGLLAVVGFAQQLITVLGGLGGALISVASSAGQAAVAIGGMGAAAAAQAAPAIGLLGAALFRVKGVMDAVNQAQLMQKQQFVQQAGAGRRVADATDSLVNAQETLKNSQRDLADAQDDLTKARKDAGEQIDELVRKEEEAKIAAADAALSQKEAAAALVAAQARGDVEGIARAQLAVVKAQNDAEQSLADRRKARADAEKAQRGGPGGTEDVQQAARRVEDAQRAVDKANRGIETAKRNQAEAAAGTVTAAANLQFFLSQLSDAERRLYTAITNFQQLFREGPMRDVTDILINSFARAVERITKIIQMPQVLGLAQRTARTLASQLNRVFDAITGDKVLDQLLRIGEEGRKNLAPVATIAERLARAFINIAEAGGPALSNFLRFVRDLAGQFERLTENQDALEDFFTTGEKHLEAWVNLGLAIIRFFLVLAGAGGARTGLGIVEDATKAIDDLTGKLDKNREGVGKFFSDSREILDQVVGVLKVLAETLFDAWRPDRVENFAKLLKQVVIPALGDVMDLLGNMTQALVDFADTPIGEKLLKGLVAFVIINRILGALVGSFKILTGVLGPVAKVFADMVVESGLLARAMPLLARAVPFVGWAAAAAAVLEYFGQLDDAIGYVGDAFEELWKQVGPPLEQLVDSFRDFADALKGNEGPLGALKDALEPLVALLVDLGGHVLVVLARALGRMLGGAIDILSGMIDILTGLLTGDWAKAWDGAKRVLSGFVKGFTAVLRILPELVWEVIKRIPGLFRRIGPAILDAVQDGFRAAFRWIRNAVGDLIDWVRHHWRDIVGVFGGPLGRIVKIVADNWRDIKRAFKKGVDDVVDFMVALPGRLKHWAEEAVKAIVHAFTGVGHTIIETILQEFRNPKEFGRAVSNAFIDLLNALLPDRIKIPHAPDIDLPDNPIPHLAGGGMVPGAGSGDRVRAMLEPGEHVWTKDEVRRAGGHAAMFALRAYFGGGGQSTGGLYQRGGQVAAQGGLTIAFEGGSLNDFRSAWREFWNDLTAIARRGSNYVEAQFRDMRVNTARSADRMYRDIRGSLADIQNSFKSRGEWIVDGWSETWNQLSKVAYDGLTYIGHETNKALHALGESHINFGLQEPKKSTGKAEGGWIGNRGQRGRDRGFYPLGAGEAVLNFAHQAQVEPAMQAYYGYGLSTMFNRVHGYHAGGPGGGGFASGGMVELDATNRLVANMQLAKTILAMMKKWKFAITAAGEGGHSANSDHHWGGALDLVPGPGGSWGLLDQLAKAAGWRPNAPMPAGGPFRWIGWNTESGHGSGNHLHLSWRRGGPFTGPGGIAGMMTDIGRLLVTGSSGGLHDIVQAVLDIVRKAANKKLDESGQFDIGSEVKLGPGGSAEKVFDFFTGHGLSDAIAAGFVGVFQKESGFSTTIGNRAGSGATGLAQWLGGRLALLQAQPNWQSLQTQLNYVWEELHGPEAGAFAAILTAKSPEEAARIIDSQYERSDNILSAPEYAREAYQRFADSKDHGRGRFEKGGVVPGGEGTPRNIVAHAGEWVLNKTQQMRLAHIAGLSRRALASMLGFYGGRGSFQGGGAIDLEEITPLTTRQVRSLDQPLRRLVVLVRALGRNFDQAVIRLGDVNVNVGVWNRYIDNTDRALVRLTRNITRRTTGRQLERSMMGFLDAVEKMTAEGGTFDRLRAAIEQRATRAARRIIYAPGGGGRFQVGRGGVVREARDAAEVAQSELREQVRQRGDLTAERSDIARELQRVEAQQRRRGLSRTVRQRLATQRNRLRGRLDEADQRISDNVQAIFDAQEAFVQAQLEAQQEITDNITKRYEAASAENERNLRRATTLGLEGEIDRLNQAQRDLLTGQANELAARVDAMRAVGTPEANEAANQILEQVADLRAQIFESIQQEIRDAADRVNARAQRRMGHLDLADRLLSAVGALGLFGGGAAGAGQPFLAGVLGGGGFSRAGVLQQRGAALQTQYQDLQGVLARAMAEGNVGLATELTDQLAELEVALAENTKALFDARVEEVNRQAQAAMTTNDLNKQIIELTGQIAGNTDQAALLANLQERGNILAEQANGLNALLADARARGDVAAIQDLETQLLQNQVATLQNTVAINEQTGAMTQPQTFSSSAWTQFREAIFTGMGQILPQYDVMGGNVMGVTTGAVVTPSNYSTNSTTGGDVNITVNEAGRPVDIQEVGSAVTFAAKTAQ